MSTFLTGPPPAAVLFKRRAGVGKDAAASMSTKKMRLTGKFDNCVYEAMLTKNEKQYWVGIVDPETKNVELVKVAGLFHGHVKVPEIDDRQNASKIDIMKDGDENDKMAIFDTFGARKKQSQLKAKANNQFKTNVEDSSGIAVKLAIKEAASEERELKQADLVNADRNDGDKNLRKPGNFEYMPKHNPSTSDVREIYVLESIIPAEYFDLLDYKPLIENADHLVCTDTKSNPKVFRCVYKLLRQLINSNVKKKSSEYKTRACAIVMLQFHLRFLNLKNVGAINKLQQLLVYNLRSIFGEIAPQAFSEYLRSEFSIPGKSNNFIISTEHGTKLRLLICVLALIGSGAYRLSYFEVKALSMDMGITESVCITHLKEVGCNLGVKKVKAVEHPEYERTDDEKVNAARELANYERESAADVVFASLQAPLQRLQVKLRILKT